MQQVLRWKYSLTTVGHKTIKLNFLQIFLMFWKLTIIDNYQAKFFSFLLVFSFASKLWTSVSRWNVRDGGNPRWVGHTWWPTRNGSSADGRETPPCAEKSFLETMKSFKMSYYYKFVFLYIEINNRYLVK